MPKVPISVVIPAYNSERFIGQAIESVLAQSVSVNEIIVVDNNCTDRTVEISEGLGAKVVRETNQNLSAARNTGIAACRNDWIAFLDSDDLWETEKIEYQWKAIEAFPQARIITCDSFLLAESVGVKNAIMHLELPSSGFEIKEISGETFLFCPKIHADLFLQIKVNASSVIYHREVFSEIGKFDEEMLYGESLEFIMRAMGHFSLALVRKNLVSIRRHDQNRTLERDVIDKYYIITAEKVAKFPGEYPTGTLEYFQKIIKLRFTAKGRELAKQNPR
jgi:glycosyltransferase involved in cell wall biosynthesis